MKIPPTMFFNSEDSIIERKINIVPIIITLSNLVILLLLANYVINNLE
ncbi:MAG: hypothetical protein WCR54_08345 [Clostridia bacterium]